MRKHHKVVCHNELDQLDYTYRDAMDDLEEALVVPRWTTKEAEREKEKAKRWLQSVDEVLF